MISTRQFIKTAVAAFLLLTLSLLSPTSASSSVDRRIFLLTKSAASYDLIQVDWMTGRQKLLTSIPAISTKPLASVLDAVSKSAVEQFFAAQSSVVTDAQDFMNLPVFTTIQSIAVSPDKQQIALNMSLQRCTRYPRTLCFGVIQVVLVNMAGNQRTVFSMDMNSSKYFGEDRRQQVSEAFISDVQWTQNQESLVIRLGDDFTSKALLNAPIVVVPIIKNYLPFGIGDARTFTLRVANNRIATISRDYSNQLPDTLNLISFNLSTGITSSSKNSIGTYATNPYVGLAYTNDKLLFWIERDIKADWGGTFGLLNLSQSSGVVPLPSPLGQPIKIQSLGKTDIIVLQGKDGTLWRIDIHDNEIQTALLIKEPVRDWVIGRNGEILVQLEGQTNYNIFDEQGTLIGKVEVQSSFSKTDAVIAIGL